MPNAEARVPEEREVEDQPRPERRAILRKVFWVVFIVAVVVSVAWFWWLYLQIRRTASVNQTQPADAIAVFGAAEYRGRPSPVFNARLQHAFDLYQRGLAPIVVALGGGSGPQYSEGAVGRDFFLSHGVPDRQIVAETASSDTEESVARLAAIARENDLRTILVVSDGTHMFRIQQLCAAEGLHVLLSPRPAGKSVGTFALAERYAHEMAGYTLWRLHLH